MGTNSFREWLRENEINKVIELEESTTKFEKYTNLTNAKYIVYPKMSHGINERNNNISGKFYFGDKKYSTNFYIGVYMIEQELKDGFFACDLLFGVASRDEFNEEVRLADTYVEYLKDSKLVKDITTVYENIEKIKINSINKIRKGNYESENIIKLKKKDYIKLVDNLIKKLSTQFDSIN